MLPSPLFPPLQKSSTKFSKIFQAFFTNKGISKEGVTCAYPSAVASCLHSCAPHPHLHAHFRFPCPTASAVQYEGVNVEEDATPESLGLEEGAKIDVMIKQTGGS